MARKFILNNNCLRIGNVNYHSELVKDHTTTKGGGMWDIDEKNKILYLWGASSDFGPADPEDIKQHIITGGMPARLAAYTVKHSAWISPNMPHSHKFTVLCTI